MQIEGRNDDASAWWSEPAAQVMQALDTTPEGLRDAQVRERLARHGPNTVVDVDEVGALRLLARQFASPLVLILVVAAAMSLVLRDWVGSSSRC